MVAINPQFITDTNGKKLSVILPMEDFNAIMEKLEEQEDIELYDKAKKEDDGERILLADYIKSRKQINA